MFSSRSVQIAAVFSNVLEKALPNLCRSFYTETKAEMFFSVFAVALLAEGVDRNMYTGCRLGELIAVALLAEGVDRNYAQVVKVPEEYPSPSSRRAWIEISRFLRKIKEDTSPSSRRAWIEIERKGIFVRHSYASPSSRRAWIEIPKKCWPSSPATVALLAEGVDRNICASWS